MTPSRMRSQVVVVLALILALSAGAPAVRAGAVASLSGKVFLDDGRTPRSGVVVSLVDDGGSRALRSTPTTEQGAFVIDEAEAGQYHLVVETEEGAFVTGDLVNLAPGPNRPVALTLRANADYRQPQIAQPTDGEGLPTWAKWAIAGGIIVGALLVINEINNDEDPASGF